MNDPHNLSDAVAEIAQLQRQLADERRERAAIFVKLVDQRRRWRFEAACAAITGAAANSHEAFTPNDAVAWAIDTADLLLAALDKEAGA